MQTYRFIFMKINHFLKELKYIAFKCSKDLDIITVNKKY